MNQFISVGLVSNTVYTVLWIVGIIVGLCILFFLSFFITLLLVKRSQKKAFEALDHLVPFERERFAVVKKAYDTLIAEKKLKANDNPLKDMVHETEIILSGTSIDMQKAKANDDFMILFLKKYLKDRSLRMKDPYKSIDETLAEYDYLQNRKDSPYDGYNKKALKYNALSSMMSVSSYCQRKGYPKAPVL